MYKVHWELFVTSLLKSTLQQGDYHLYSWLLNNMHWGGHKNLFVDIYIRPIKKLPWCLTSKLPLGNAKNKNEYKDYDVNMEVYEKTSKKLR